MGKKTRSADTPATVVLEKSATAFTLHSYDHDPAAASYGEEAAQALGVEPGRVFKPAERRRAGGSLPTDPK